MKAAPRTLFYLTENEAWLPFLGEVSDFKVVAIRSQEELCRNLLLKSPDVVLVESDMEWMSALEMIEYFEASHEVPIAILINPECVERDPALLRRAYAAGVTDTLFAPIQKDELLASLNLLLKLRSQAQG